MIVLSSPTAGFAIAIDAAAAETLTASLPSALGRSWIAWVVRIHDIIIVLFLCG